MAVSKVTKENFHLAKQAEAAVVDFYADWCGPCGKLSPIVEKISDEYENVEFFKLDIDADMDIAMNNQIVSIPTLLIFKGGEKVGQIVGYMEEAELKANIEKALQ